MHYEKYNGQDEENVNEKSGDVEGDES